MCVVSCIPKSVCRRVHLSKRHMPDTRMLCCVCREQSKLALKLSTIATSCMQLSNRKGKIESSQGLAAFFCWCPLPQHYNEPRRRRPKCAVQCVSMLTTTLSDDCFDLITIYSPRNLMRVFTCVVLCCSCDLFITLFFTYTSITVFGFSGTKPLHLETRTQSVISAS